MAQFKLRFIGEVYPAKVKLAEGMTRYLPYF